MSGRLGRQSLSRQHISRAQAAMDAFSFDTARTEVESALRLDPSSLVARLLEARIALHEARPSDALRAVDSAGLYHPDKQSCPDLSMLRAEALLRSEHFHEASKQLVELVNHFPHDLRPRRMLAQLCVRTKRTDDAIVHLKLLLKLDPSDKASASTLADLLESKQPQESIDLLMQCAEESDHPADRLRVAQRCGETERHADAEVMYRRLLNDQAADADIWLLAGQLADGQGAIDAAEKRLLRAATLSRHGDGRAWRALATSLLHRGDWARAGRYWHRAARCGDNDHGDWAGLLLCAMMSGRERLARKAAERLSMHFSPAQRRQKLADLWHHAAGGALVSEAIACAVHRPVQKAGVLDQLVKRSAEALSKQAADHPRRADMHYHLAVARNAIGDTERAHHAVQTALAINPRYTAARKLADKVVAMFDGQAAA